MLAMVFLGVDPGLRGTLGWTVVRVRLTPQGAHPVEICDCGCLNVNRIGPRVTAGRLFALAERYGVSEVMIEDFLYWNGHPQEPGEGQPAVRTASRRTVERMQFLIGYLTGFLSSRYLPVEVVHPRRWKSRVREEELQELGEMLPCCRQTVSPHVLDALGVVLGELRARVSS